MPRELEGIRELLRVELPAELDALVQQRAQLLLLSSAPCPTSLDSRRGSESSRPGRGSAPPTALPVTLARAERWMYALGLFAYGTRVLSGALRLLWQSVAE
jgi:hypothetical protein